MVDEVGHEGHRRGFLASTLGGGGEEDSAGLVDQLAGLPEPTGGVPEGLHLRAHASVPGGDTHDDAVVLL
jgi:hypothetical protein